MGSSHAREHGPLNVVIESVSIVQGALPHVADMARGEAPLKQKTICDRIARQQDMISDRYKTDVWFCLYLCLLRATEMHITGKAMSREQIQNMFGDFQDTSEEQRSPFDLATQILMIVHHLLLLSGSTDIDMAERWQFHDNIASSIQSAEKRFRFLRPKIDKPHRPALQMLFRILSGIYVKRPRAVSHNPDTGSNNNHAKSPPPSMADAKGTRRSGDGAAKPSRTRRVTRSYSGGIVVPTDWSED